MNGAFVWLLVGKKPIVIALIQVHLVGLELNLYVHSLMSNIRIYTQQ